MSGLIIPFHGVVPKIHPEAFIAANVTLIGNVELGRRVSLWYGVIIRGDVNVITIGENTNIQDGTVIHVNHRTHPTHIGARVTVGHACMIHGCTLEDDSFVGMHATVLDGAVIESGGMVAAGALVPPNKRVKAGELWAGNPAKLLRMLSDEERVRFAKTWENYAARGEEYRQMLAEQAQAAE